MSNHKQRREDLRMMFGGYCAYCGQLLQDGKWHGDHVKPILRDSMIVRNIKTGRRELRQNGKCFRPENKNAANIYPSCRACNIDKSSMSLESWRYSLALRPGVCRRNHSAFRHAERFGLVVEVKKPIVFWFENYKV